MIGRSSLALVALCSLMVFATSASAECAWVLWETTSWPTKKTSTEPIRAYPAKADCEHERDVRERPMQFRVVPGNGLVVGWRGGSREVRKLHVFKT